MGIDNIFSQCKFLLNVGKPVKGIIYPDYAPSIFNCRPVTYNQPNVLQEKIFVIWKWTKKV